MSDPIIYIDRSQVAPGRLNELKRRIGQLARLVEQQEPRLIAYQVFFDETERTMTVIHVHRDSRSLAMHFETAGPHFDPFRDLVELKSIEVYGRPDPDVLPALRAKAASLGNGSVSLHQHHAGFLRAFGAGSRVALP